MFVYSGRTTRIELLPAWSDTFGSVALLATRVQDAEITIDELKWDVDKKKVYKSD